MKSFVEDLASQLERELGPCPASRRVLLDWVDSQIDRCSLLGAPGEAAMAMIYSGYLEWCALLLERDQPLDDQVRDEF